MTSIIDRPTSAPEHSQPWRQKVYSSGWTDGRGEQIAVTDKATGVVLGSVGSGTSEDLDGAVAAARTAQRGWAAAPYSERAAVLLRAAAILGAEPDRLLPWLIREAGSAQGQGRLRAVPASAVAAPRIAVTVPAISQGRATSCWVISSPTCLLSCTYTGWSSARWTR